MSFNITPENK